MTRALEPSYRFRAGMILGLNYTANASPSFVRGVVGVKYDDGLTEEFILMATSLTTTRATFVIYPGTQQTTEPTQTFFKPGVVEYAQVVQGGATKIAQRGQLYCSLVIADLASFEAITLCADYLFTGNSLTLGVVVAPGPAGGPGNMRTIFSNDPAAGVEITILAVPTGALWRPHTLGIQLVQGITQTPTPALRIRDSAANVLAQIPITTTPIGASSTAQLTWARGCVQESFTTIVGDEMHTAPMPQIDMVAADDIGIITDGIGANTNYGFASLRIEEWVMPN